MLQGQEIVTNAGFSGFRWRLSSGWFAIERPPRPPVEVSCELAGGFNARWTAADDEYASRGLETRVEIAQFRDCLLVRAME